MHHVALVRSVTHEARLHDSASIHALTGRPLDGPDRELFSPLPQVYPSYGSALAHARRDRPADVPFASLPFTFRNVVDVPCQGAGFLGSAFDPLRVEVDARGDKIGSKIRDATLARVPYLLVAGAKEAASGQVAVRERSGTDLGAMAVDDFAALARQKIRART